MKSNISPDLEGQIAAIRGFSRFYTRKLGIIEPKLLDSPWTLQEARIIYELAERQSCTATDLVRALGLDAGFMSRTLQALQHRQIIARKPSRTDRRVTELALTARGLQTSTADRVAWSPPCLTVWMPASAQPSSTP
jgi:DNA-binding MarR family transcriptional regulator